MHKKLFIAAMFAASSVSLSGCSSMWSGVGDFADMMSERTEFLSLRGMSKKKEEPVLVAENTVDSEDVLMTDAGVYLPETESEGEVASDEIVEEIVFTNAGTVPCPEGTVMTEDNVCLLIE